MKKSAEDIHYFLCTQSEARKRSIEGNNLDFPLLILNTKEARF